MTKYYKNGLVRGPLVNILLEKNVTSPYPVLLIVSLIFDPASFIWSTSIDHSPPMTTLSSI